MTILYREGAILLNIKMYQESRQTRQDVQGIRKGVKTVVIETRERLDFKERDKVVLDRGEFKVTSVDFIPSIKTIVQNIFLKK